MAGLLLRGFKDYFNQKLYLIGRITQVLGPYKALGTHRVLGALRVVGPWARFSGMPKCKQNNL